MESRYQALQKVRETALHNGCKDIAAEAERLIREYYTREAPHVTPIPKKSWGQRLVALFTEDFIHGLPLWIVQD